MATWVPRNDFSKNKEQTIKQMQLKFDPVPAKFEEICLFQRRCIKIIYDANILSIVNKIWSSILQKWSGSNSHQTFARYFTKQPYFWHSENEKWFFRTKKMKTSFDKLVSHSNMHPFVQYEIIWENYPLKLALTSVIWLESHEPSYSIAHFEKNFLRYLHYSKFIGLYG